MNKAEYNPLEIEQKWQKVWSEVGIYEPDTEKSQKPFYNLMMFPYPSAEGLHVGNMYAFCGSDIYGRYQRMKGNDVFEPIGLDGFGIHSENFALKIGEHPADLSKRTEANFYKQLHMIGNGYAWSHKLETYDPAYYHWTQWIFIELFKAGLAYKGKATVNWCPHCLTVLADEQAVKQVTSDQEPVTRNVCERCGTEVERKDLSQWFFRITSYAQRLLENLDKLDWSEKVKVAQRNWIGKSEGAKVMFQSDIEDNCLIEVFTTRPDTIFGVTFLVLAPEHPLVTRIINKANGPLQQEIRQYVDYSLKKTEDERLETKIEAKNRVKTEVLQSKSGVFSGFYAINPLNKKKVPIYIADYVLMSYGTGAVMGVPAHDQRDWEFAKKYELDIIQVIEPTEGQKGDISQGAFTEEGRLVNSGQFNGLTTEDGIQSIIKYINKNQIGTPFATWHLRDWTISRQRYWGPPIPMIYCEKCAKEGKSWFAVSGTPAVNALKLGYLRSRGQRSVVNLHGAQVDRNSKTAPLQAASPRMDLDWDSAGWYPVPQEDLPVELPNIKNFKPTGTGVSPLAQDKDFVNVKCPGCGFAAKRETDVSDTFLDSAWYFLRYPSQSQKSKVKSQKLPWDAEITKKWLPVDMYVGGAEHAVLHLLYSRFLTMALYDLGLVEFEEPFSKFRVNGLLIKDGAKMSKSKGNVVNPDDYIAKFGADTLRCYLMFCGRFREGGDFRDTGIEGMHRFLRRVWRLVQENSKFKIQNSKVEPEDLRMMHKTIKKVTEDIESLDYNTAIAALMEWVNFLEGKVSKVSKESNASKVSFEEAKTLLLLLAPFAPYMTEELYQKFFGNSKSEARNSKQTQNSKFRSIHKQLWPEYEEDKIKSDITLLIVQVNGKMREKIEVKVDLSQEEAERTVLALPKVAKYLENAKYRTVYVPGKIINFVTLLH